ncbi:MAG TPA: class I SAM-dependent methyltransferase [Candidatus Limnocylindria bacterium]|nr:class I SAM-dependent methyltransferase [Candidatus Limnocylindria bacterium]
MSNRSIGLDENLHAYLLKVGVREHPVLAALRDETARMPNHNMQIAPEQGALLALLVRLGNVRRIVEIGTFTGYSSTAMALALPPDGRIVCCDVNREWTDVARGAWTDAGVADRVELRLGPALETLDQLLAEGGENSFDMAFIDANKSDYDGYYEAALRLLRPGGLVAIDNVLWSGRVADPSDRDEDTDAIRALNAKIAADERVELGMTPVGDGLTLARLRDA